MNQIARAVLISSGSGSQLMMMMNSLSGSQLELEIDHILLNPGIEALMPECYHVWHCLSMTIWDGDLMLDVLKQPALDRYIYM